MSDDHKPEKARSRSGSRKKGKAGKNPTSPVWHKGYVIKDDGWEAPVRPARDAARNVLGKGAPRALRSAPPARALALSVLRDIMRTGADLQAALDDALKTGSLSRQDAALCTELVYGYFRSEIRISWLLERFLKDPTGLPSEVFDVLGLAAYEITALDRIPAYASVDWAVSCIRATFGEGLSRLANAVLRNLVRMDGAYADPAFYCAQLPVERERLSIQYAAPLWLVDLWVEGYGSDVAEKLLDAATRHPASGIRVNALRPEAVALRDRLLASGMKDVATTGAVAPAVAPAADVSGADTRHSELPASVAPGADATGIAAPGAAGSGMPGAVVSGTGSVAVAGLERATAVAVGSYGIMFPAGGAPSGLDELVAAGVLSRQSGASQAALLALEPLTWPAPVWDCCCGRGGKTAFLVELGVPVVAASDVSMARLRGLVREFKRLDLPLPRVFCAPADRPALPIEDEDVPAEELAPVARYGAVLVDAPCSGLGTLSRRPDIKLKRTEHQIEELVALQGRILESVWQTILPGGVLAYVTCTRNPQENELRIAALLAEHADASLEKEYETPLDDPSREFFYAALVRKQA